MKTPLLPLSLLLSMGAFYSIQAAHQTETFDDPVAPVSLPFQLTMNQVSFTTQIPTLHSYASGQWEGQWVLLAGKTNGLHGMTGGGTPFDPAYENREVWVIDPVAGQSWKKSLATSPASGLTNDVVDSLSSVNTQYLQVDATLYVLGGYGYKRSLANYTTYGTLTAIDLPGLISWVKAPEGTETSTAASHVRQVSDTFFKVTGGGLEKIGEEFQLIFGQDYEGSYRPNFNGIYTRQVRRFRVVNDAGGLSVVPNSKLATTPLDDYRRRDLNVLPILERDLSLPGLFLEKALVLGGVFTPTNGVWTRPVVVSENGVVTQAEPTNLKQSVQQYHCAKMLAYHRATDEMHTILLGGISLKFWDPMTQTYVQDDNAPFVNDVTDVVRFANGSMRQYRLPYLFPDIKAPWDGTKSLYFGTNAEFFSASDVSKLTPKILDLASIMKPQKIGWVHGGIMADARNGGRTAASGYIFEVWLTPLAPLMPQMYINPTITGYQVNWIGSASRGDVLESSADLLNWFEVMLPVRGAQTFYYDGLLDVPRRFHRTVGGTITTE